MDDLFEREQAFLERANRHLAEIQHGAPCDPEEFFVLAREYERVLRLVRQLTRVADKTTLNLNLSKLDLLDKVNIDGLTGIYNRRFMEERLAQEIAVLSRFEGGGTLSLLMLDIDFFKKYNDIYGHCQGDACLRSVADVLQGSLLRKSDFVARYGGEEFVAVLPNTDEPGARSMAERMRENVLACAIPHRENEAADYVTISIGATTARVMHFHQAGDYIQRADKALYESKTTGRNRCTFIPFEEEPQ